VGIEIRVQLEREKPNTKFLKHKQTNKQTNPHQKKKKKKAQKAKKKFLSVFAQSWKLLCCWSRVLVPCPVFWSCVLVAGSSFAAVAARLTCSFPSLSRLSLSFSRSFSLSLAVSASLQTRPDPLLLSSSSTLLQLQEDPMFHDFQQQQQ
jgi:hypothetical protein